MPAATVALESARWAAVPQTTHDGSVDRSAGLLENHVPVPPSRRLYLPDDDRTFVGFAERLLCDLGLARDQSCGSQPGDGQDGARGSNFDRGGADVLSHLTLFERHLRRRSPYASVELANLPANGEMSRAGPTTNESNQPVEGWLSGIPPAGASTAGRSQSLW